MKISLFDIAGNVISNSEVSRLIVQKLEEKYNEKFLVKMIGNRYGMGTFNEATAYCCPANCEKMIFTVTFDMVKEVLLSDDFFIKTTCYELEKNILNEFQKKKIDAFSKVEIFGKNTLDKIYSVQEFTDKYYQNNFLAIIVVKDDISEKKLNDIFSNIKNKFNNIYLKTLIYIMENSDFDKCHKLSETVPNLTTSFIEHYSIKYMNVVKVYKDEIIKIK